MNFNDHGMYIYRETLCVVNHACDESQVACRMTLGNSP